MLNPERTTQATVNEKMLKHIQCAPRPSASGGQVTGRLSMKTKNDGGVC